MMKEEIDSIHKNKLIEANNYLFTIASKALALDLLNIDNATKLQGIDVETEAKNEIKNRDRCRIIYESLVSKDGLKVTKRSRKGIDRIIHIFLSENKGQFVLKWKSLWFHTKYFILNNLEISEVLGSLVHEKASLSFLPFFRTNNINQINDKKVNLSKGYSLSFMANIIDGDNYIRVVNADRYLDLKFLSDNDLINFLAFLKLLNAA